MSAKERVADSLFWLIAGTLYVFAVTDGILSATVFFVPWETLLPLSALFVGGFLLAFFNGRTALVFLGAGVLFAAVTGISLAAGGFGADWLGAGRELLRELSLFLAGRSPYRQEYGRILAVVLCLVTGFLTVLTTRLRFCFSILAVAALWVFAAPVYNGWGESPRALALMTLCIVILLVKKQNLIALSAGTPGRAAGYALLLIPLAGVCFAFARSLPTPEFTLGEGGGAAGIREAADRFLSNLRPAAIGTFTTEGAPLGGPVSLSEDHVMDVAAPEPLYLSGSVRDVYDGVSWRVSDDAKRGMAPAEGNAYAVNIYPPELAELQWYNMRYYGMAAGTVRITPGEVPTRLLFAPPYRLTLETEEELELSAGIYGAVESEGILREGEGYTQSYISWDYENPYVLGLLAGGAGGEAPGLTEEERELFLSVPESLPDRVRELAEELAAGSLTDYDRMTALAGYLARFPYTLMPDPVPPDVDFVDHFLFEERRGYCVYYATALAVMGRTLGIPTRYAEGYITPEEPDENGVYAVDGQLAHAWAEAWFDGFGWVIFEATRPYAVEAEGGIPGMSENYIPEETTPDAGAVPIDYAALEAARNAETLRRVTRWAVTILTVAAAAALAVLILKLRFKMRFERIGALPNREAAAVWFVMVLRQASSYGLTIHREETALAYAERVRERLKFRDHSIAELAEIFSRAAYSKNEVTDGDLSALRDCHRQMLIRMLAQGRPVRRAIERYILLRY